MQISVKYTEELTTSQAVEVVRKLQAPVVFLWYIGIYGLKTEGVHFYKKSIIDPLLSVNNALHFILFDLTAWGSFKSKKTEICKHSKFCKIINDFKHPKIRCWKSSDILSKLVLITDKSVVSYLKKSLNRSDLRKPSENSALAHFKLRDVFGNNCQLIEEFDHIDASRGYSIIQYLEACLLICEVALENSQKTELSIAFVLPNDELKYYKDAENTLEKDVSFLIMHLQTQTKLKSVNIHFIAFKYGNSTTNRPYNSPGKTFKKNALSLDDIVSENYISTLGE